MIRVLYAGSPEASAKTLSLLFDGADGYEIAGVLTNPPSAQGRHKTPVPTPVARFAEEHGIPLFTPEHLDAASREKIIGIRPDILVCFAYGHISEIPRACSRKRRDFKPRRRNGRHRADDFACNGRRRYPRAGGRRTGRYRNGGRSSRSLRDSRCRQY